MVFFPVGFLFPIALGLFIYFLIQFFIQSFKNYLAVIQRVQSLLDTGLQWGAGRLQNYLGAYHPAGEADEQVITGLSGCVQFLVTINTSAFTISCLEQCKDVYGFLGHI